jgi:hypothetical protein
MAESAQGYISGLDGAVWGVWMHLASSIGKDGDSRSSSDLGLRL